MLWVGVEFHGYFNLVFDFFRTFLETFFLELFRTRALDLAESVNDPSRL